jgi:hypothetical protein
VDKLERVLLDDQVWAYRTGEVTTVANLSDQAVTRPLEGGERLSVLISTRSSGLGATVGHELRLEPWEALVLSADG